MKTIDFILKGFGFENLQDFKVSAFGFVLTSKITKVTAFLALVASFLHDLLGVKPMFLGAYCVLIIFEWYTGIKASYKQGKPHQSRKMGRMLFKIAVYSIPVYILNQFHTHSHFPMIMDYEIDPFVWLYWAVLIGIIWQLLISLLENLAVLGFKWATMLIRIINKKFYEKFGIDENHNGIK